MLASIFCLLIAAVTAEVTVLSGVQTLYSRSPKLRIKGTGFDADEHHIFLDMSASGQPSLKLDKDYMITKDDEGLILKLLTNRKWADLEGRKPPVALVLNAVRLNSQDSENLLPDKVILANVLQTPDVFDNDQMIYSTATNELRINGTGFIGAKKLDLYFDPPLLKGIAYEIVSPFPIQKNEVVLRLRHSYQWREEPGPLYVIGVDTGGGPIKTNGDDGVRVAEVQADLDAHGVTVEDTYVDQVIYNDAPSVYIKGEGFNKLGTVFRFANGILGKGVNYTTATLTENYALLKLVPGSYWRKNVENLPGFLTLLAVNAGAGFVAVGPTNAKKGRDIARVFEKPVIYSGNTKLYQTHSHELHIYGEGFPTSMSKPKLEFSPALSEGADYDITVMDRTEMIINLRDGVKWSENAGPLLVTKINTRGDMDGWVDLPGDGVHVAEILADIDSDQTGGVTIYPSATRVYQSSLQDSIIINGAGFNTESISVTFDPPLKESVDYDMDVMSKTQLRLRLRKGKKWAPKAGTLVVKAVVMNYKTYPLAQGEGIRVAIILADPVIEPGADNFHETQSKVIAVYGHGFTNVADVKVELQPTKPENYKILAVTEDTIRLQLKEGYDWLPSHLNLNDAPEDASVPLQLLSIDTGAGKISFNNAPITIGKIIRDREGVICDDSCEFAFDGVCDDGTDQSSYYYGGSSYYGAGANTYKDDDLGGYYNDMGRTGDFYYGEGNIIDDDYYMENDAYRVSACVEGTDCTDCGGVDAIIDWSQAVNNPDSGVEACTNTCVYARDGVCDDPRGANYCKIGTDCQDCGPVGADNFTKTDDDAWWDDDDDYWTFNDGLFIDQAKGVLHNQEHIKRHRKPALESAGPAAMFLTVLEGLVYTIGFIFASIGVYLMYRWYHGLSLPFLHVFSPEHMQQQQQSGMSARDFELAPTKKMPITPDVIRT